MKKALTESKNLENEKNVNVAILFDNEEIGSETAHGAGSPMVQEVIKRVTGNLELYELAIRRSFLISADMAHAVHPNVKISFEI